MIATAHMTQQPANFPIEQLILPPHQVDPHALPVCTDEDSYSKASKDDSMDLLEDTSNMDSNLHNNNLLVNTADHVEVEVELLKLCQPTFFGKGQRHQCIGWYIHGAAKHRTLSDKAAYFN